MKVEYSMMIIYSDHLWLDQVFHSVVWLWILFQQQQKALLKMQVIEVFKKEYY